MMDKGLTRNEDRLLFELAVVEEPAKDQEAEAKESAPTTSA